MAAERWAVGEVDVRAIREGLELSRSAFAARFGRLAETVQNREQGRTRPDEPAQVPLWVIARDAEAVDPTPAAGEAGRCAAPLPTFRQSLPPLALPAQA